MHLANHVTVAHLLCAENIFFFNLSPTAITVHALLTQKHEMLAQRWFTVGQRRRRWSNSKPTSGQRLMFAGKVVVHCVRTSVPTKHHADYRDRGNKCTCLASPANFIYGRVEAKVLSHVTFMPVLLRPVNNFLGQVIGNASEGKYNKVNNSSSGK